MEILRTPDDRFADLPGFDFEPLYCEVDGLRLARIEAGEGDPVVFLHGEPTWSYLWRKVIAPIADAGHRCIAPDLAGFGRSDKPADLGWYTYDRHVELTKKHLAELGVTNATLVCHDWGGPIGLRLAAENPGLFDRLVVMDTGLFTGRQRMSEAWHRFRDFVERTEDLPISMLVRNACATDPGDEVAAAYDAPFPGPEYKAGARAFPLILPLSPEDPGGSEGEAAFNRLGENPLPGLALWADGDPVLPFEAVGERVAAALGLPPPVKIENASHFLQEDQGEEIGRQVAAWLKSAG
jgi:haloalkane dehalogenase